MGNIVGDHSSDISCITETWGERKELEAKSDLSARSYTRSDVIYGSNRSLSERHVAVAGSREVRGSDSKHEEVKKVGTYSTGSIRGNGSSFDANRSVDTHLRTPFRAEPYVEDPVKELKKHLEPLLLRALRAVSSREDQSWVQPAIQSMERRCVQLLTLWLQQKQESFTSVSEAEIQEVCFAQMKLSSPKQARVYLEKVYEERMRSKWCAVALSKEEVVSFAKQVFKEEKRGRSASVIQQVCQYDKRVQDCRLFFQQQLVKSGFEAYKEVAKYISNAQIIVYAEAIRSGFLRVSDIAEEMWEQVELPPAPLSLLSRIYSKPPPLPPGPYDNER